MWQSYVCWSAVTIKQNYQIREQLMQYHMYDVGGPVRQTWKHEQMNRSIQQPFTSQATSFYDRHKLWFTRKTAAPTVVDLMSMSIHQKESLWYGSKALAWSQGPENYLTPTVDIYPVMSAMYSCMTFMSPIDGYMGNLITFFAESSRCS